MLGDEEAALPLCAPDPEALVVERESAERLLLRLKELLTAREYAVLLRYLDGYSYAEIAAAMRLSQKAVDNALQRVRRKVAIHLSKQVG